MNFIIGGLWRRLRDFLRPALAHEGKLLTLSTCTFIQTMVKWTRGKKRGGGGGGGGEEKKNGRKKRRERVLGIFTRTAVLSSFRPVWQLVLAAKPLLRGKGGSGEEVCLL